VFWCFPDGQEENPVPKLKDEKPKPKIRCVETVMIHNKGKIYGRNNDPKERKKSFSSQRK